MNCPFCDKEHMKDKLIKEKKNCFVLLSNPRLVPGHLLVIPNRHIQKISELNEEEKKELFDTVIEFQEKVLKFAKGCDIRQHFRPFQKQDGLKLDHLHIHLLPREFEDELYKRCQIHEKGIFKAITEAEKEKFSKIYS